MARGKWVAEKTVVDGIKFASKAEAARYGELKLMQRAGEISDLKVQPRFPLVVNGIQVAAYVADFRYLDKRRAIVVEDVKSPVSRTPVYMLKKKLMAACHGLEVREVMARRQR